MLTTEVRIQENSAQRMRHLAQKEQVYLAAVRPVKYYSNQNIEVLTIEKQKEISDEEMEINKDKAKIPYPKELQKILMKYVGGFVRIH